MQRFKKFLSAFLAVIMCISIMPIAGYATAPDGLDNFIKRNSFKENLFADVSKSNWFYDNVKAAYELGLMIGKSDDTFAPSGEVTIAETITVAARIHSIYHTGKDSFEKSTPWYKTYVDYANVNGITSISVNDYTKPATRAQFATIVANALPDVALEGKNQVADDAIPDVKTTDACGAAVYKLYRAGIMVGSDDKGTFAPASNIKRSEVAAIVTRMADKALRRSVRLGEEFTVTFDMNGHGSQISAQTVVKGYTTEKPSNPKEDNYEFKGWYTQKTGGKLYDFSTLVTSNITLYAYWEVDASWVQSLINALKNRTFTISFETNGGTPVASQKVKQGKTVTMPANPTKDGFVFAGWYVDAALTVEYDFAAAVTKSMTLYAKWVENIDGGSDDDGDGIGYDWEIILGLDPNSDDTDKDGLTDDLEIALALDATKPDTDDDGIFDGDEDTDDDGLTNLEELSYNTDPSDSDTDNDGLNDSEEIDTYNTNPLKYDTDGDGAADGWEVANNYDPLTYNDSFMVTESATDDHTEVSVTLPLDGGNIESLSIEPVTDNLLFDETIPGYIGSPFNFTVEGDFEEATITFKFDESLLGSEDFCPTIYYFNEETQFFEELETIVVGNAASTKVNHFSTYILLNKTEFDKVWESEIKPPDYTSEITGLDVVFVIDSSGSMYSNDRSNLRLLAAKNFVDKLGEHDRAAVVDFDSSATLFQEFTSDHALLYAAIDKVNMSGGTNLGRGINKAIEQFTADTYIREDAYKYIIFLTDGDGSYSTSYTSTASENNIVIYTIGLGSGVKESVLKGIAEGTGGKYYFASAADVLADIYKAVAEETVDYVTDSNKDEISDYYTKFLCEGVLTLGSGKATPFHGLSIEEVQANADYDNDGLLNGEELVVEFDEEDKTIYVWMMSDPTSADSDFDGIKDKDEKAALNNKFDGKMLGYYDIADASYIFDYSQFFKSASAYSDSLCSASLMLSNVIYSDGGFCYETGEKFTDIAEMMRYHGFENVIDYALTKGYKSEEFDVCAYHDDDVSEIGIGYHEVNYNGVTKTIIGIVVRGTNGTIEEWSSNFDIGDKATWDKDIHRGFYVAEERIKKFVDLYVNTYLCNVDNLTYWITGHSRGAAIANILAANLIDEKNEVYAYTFATPATTIRSNRAATKYNSILNFTNASDFVTYVPLKEWDFGRFGVTYDMSIEGSNLEFEWCRQTGATSYNALSEEVIISATSKIVENCCSSWDEIHDTVGAQDIDDTQYGYISERAKRYCDLKEITSMFGKHKGWKLYPSLAFVFQLVAEGLYGNNEEKSNVIELLPEFWNSKYTWVILLFFGDAFFSNSLNGIEISETLVGDGHAPATYYILFQN